MSARRRHAVLVDDERLARFELRTLLEQAHADQVHVVGEAASVADAARLVHATDADVVFLDIQLAGETGMDLLPVLGADVDVVFVTAYDEYAVPAFETEALDYLSKPVPPDRLAKTIARVRERLKSSVASASTGTVVPESPDHLLTRIGDRDVVIPVSDIDCIEADGVYAGVVVGERRYLVRTSLDTLERTLPAPAFMRVHRSWIVPRDRIASIRRSATGLQREIVLKSGAVVPVSRRRQPVVMRVLRGG